MSEPGNHTVGELIEALKGYAPSLRMAVIGVDEDGAESPARFDLRLEMSETEERGWFLAVTGYSDEDDSNATRPEPEPDAIEIAVDEDEDEDEEES